MVLDRAASWRVDYLIRNDVGNIRHHAQVDIECAENIDALLVTHAIELPDRPTQPFCGRGQRFSAPWPVRRGENPNYLMFRSVRQFLKNRFTERRLADQCEFHGSTRILESESAAKWHAVALNV